MMVYMLCSYYGVGCCTYLVLALKQAFFAFVLVNCSRSGDLNLKAFIETKTAF